MDGKNTLAYFLCAQYEVPTPSPKNKNKTKVERPKLRSCIPKPLAFWDSVYYAAVAAVRQLYDDLQQRFGADFGGGITPIILHNAGFNGADTSARHPWSALQMAAQLEEMWFALMDQRVVSALDKAVRLKQVDAQIGDLPDNNTEEASQKVAALFAKAEGLMDVNSMTPDQIMAVLWSNHTGDWRRDPSVCFEAESLLAACRAEVREAATVASYANNPNVMPGLCICRQTCQCRDLCIFQINECACSIARSELRETVREQHIMQTLMTGQMENTHTMPNNMYGAVTNDVAQMQVAAMATANPYIVQALHSTSEAANKLDAQVLQNRRARTNTNNRDLAYVPGPRTPTRGRKDSHALDFYGTNSGQRYPGFHQDVFQTKPPPVYGPSAYSTTMPPRKPVPALLVAPQIAPAHSPAHAQSSMGAMTPPTSSPFDITSFAQAGQITYPPIPYTWQSNQVTYPAIPVSQSQGMFTQSFPTTNAGNPRSAATEKLVDDSVPAADYTDLAAEAQSMTNPFADEASFPHTHHQASSNRSTFASSPPPLSQPSSARKSNLNLSKPVPPLPEPDFIAPRPALKQRYVSAGGPAKLSERTEIAGPTFTQQASGAAMHKDELYGKLSDPAFIKQNFGEGAVKMSVDVQRRSDDSGRSGSKRGSGDSLTKLVVGEKRERTGSGESTGSGRFGKLKRVFSRKGSGCE